MPCRIDLREDTGGFLLVGQSRPILAMERCPDTDTNLPLNGELAMVPLRGRELG